MSLKSDIIEELNVSWGEHKSYRELLDVAKRYAVEKLGEGSSRIVFDLGGNKCLKIAKNKFGTAQMKAECDVSEENVPIFSKVYEYDDEYFIWEVCELCREANVDDFREILGVDFNMIVNKIEERVYGFYEDNWEDEDAEFQKHPEAVKFIDELVDAIQSYSLEGFDLEMLQNYGVSVDGTIKVIDYGLNPDSYGEIQ